MEKDDETTATQLQALLTSEGYSLSISTIQRSRSRLGWTFRRSAYCQLIREANKEKRLAWARENLTAALMDGFTNVVWTDETSVQMESHRRHSFRKRGRQPRPKPRLWLLHFTCTFIYILPVYTVLVVYMTTPFSYCHLQSETSDQSPRVGRYQLGRCY